MKIRLSITVGINRPIHFVHSGPIIRIGRDPECELSLQGEASDKLSRQHARIELTAGGATIADTGSSNGTLLNGRLLEGPGPLCVGDRIQMGYTGATLTVLDLELNARPPLGVAKALRNGVVAVVAVAAVCAVAGVALHQTETPNEQARRPAAVAVVSSRPAETSAALLPVAPPADIGKQLPPSTEIAKPPPPPPVKPVLEEPTKGISNEDVKEIGSYVALDQWVSVLLQRQGEANPWAVLRPEARVATGYTLVSLPGYRSLIALDSGLHLMLWGNLPEFSAFPPVLESVAMLHNPSTGIDVDFTLDRGRALLTNRKASGGLARVRLHILHEAWELELPDAKSEVGVELWFMPRGAPAPGAGPQPPAACLGLFTKGRVRVRTPHQTLDLADRARVSWVSQEPAALHRTNLPELPAWWTKPLERKTPQVQKALRSLLDWRDQLGSSGTDPAQRKKPANGETSVITTIKTQVEEVKDADNQDVGVFFLAALDETEPLVGFLADRQNANVRGVTCFALQSWLSRDGQHAGELARILERRGDSKDKAERIVRLLHFYPPEALNQRKTYDDLVGYLDDGNLLVRDLAFWHLDQMGVSGRLPKEAREIVYDPIWEAEKRRPAVEQWKKLISEGKVPLPPRR